MIDLGKHPVTIQRAPSSGVTVTLFTVLVTKMEGVFLAQRGYHKPTSMTDL